MANHLIFNAAIAETSRVISPRSNQAAERLGIRTKINADPGKLEAWRLSTIKN